MKQKAPIPFWKLSGSGNDFIIIDYRRPLPSKEDMRLFVSKVCRRGMSVGADGVILIKTSEIADYGWHFFNADGGEAEMCANGSRCAARFAVENNIAPPKHSFETQVGIVQAEVLPGGKRVKVQLPDPKNLKLNVAIEIGRGHETSHSVNTGVPHVIYFVDDVEKVDVVSLGRQTRYHASFAPEGTNVNFVTLSGAQQMNIRTYERGVENETLACGTGSIAAALVAAALGKIKAPVSLRTRSGIMLTVDFKREGDAFKEISLEGDARIIYKGEIEKEALL